VSVTATPVSAVALGLVRVILKRDGTPMATGVVRKVFATVGGRDVLTVNVADWVSPVPALVVVTEPVELVWRPLVLVVTVTVSVQLSPPTRFLDNISKKFPPPVPAGVRMTVGFEVQIMLPSNGVRLTIPEPVG